MSVIDYKTMILALVVVAEVVVIVCHQSIQTHIPYHVCRNRDVLEPVHYLGCCLNAIVGFDPVDGGLKAVF